MTKNRARKQATRQRAALTGERYVVAQRALAESPKTSRAHELMHSLPGVPAHVEGGLQAAAAPARNTRHGLRQRARHGEPRVLVAWQNWIARRVGSN